MHNRLREYLPRHCVFRLRQAINRTSAQNPGLAVIIMELSNRPISRGAELVFLSSLFVPVQRFVVLRQHAVFTKWSRTSRSATVYSMQSAFASSGLVQDKRLSEVQLHILRHACLYRANAMSTNMLSFCGIVHELHMRVEAPGPGRFSAFKCITDAIKSSFHH